MSNEKQEKEKRYLVVDSDGEAHNLSKEVLIKWIEDGSLQNGDEIYSITKHFTFRTRTVKFMEDFHTTEEVTVEDL